MEQYSRVNNVEINFSFLVTEGEYCAAIMQTIGARIDCKAARSEFDVVHRVATVKPGAKNLFARICLRTKKVEFVSKTRTSDCLELEPPIAPVTFTMTSHPKTSHSWHSSLKMPTTGSSFGPITVKSKPGGVQKARCSVSLA